MQSFEAMTLQQKPENGPSDEPEANEKVVLEFLTPIKQEKHVKTFLDEEFDTLDKILELTFDDLRNELKLPLAAAKVITKKIEEINGTGTTKDALEASAMASIPGFGLSNSKKTIISGTFNE